MERDFEPIEGLELERDFEPIESFENIGNSDVVEAGESPMNRIEILKDLYSNKRNLLYEKLDDISDEGSPKTLKLTPY